MTRKLLPLAFVLVLAAAACAEPPSPEVEFGSGQRFVPFVADPLNDAGLYPSVMANEEGLPVVAYFAFEEQTEEGELPAVRPVTAPTLPGVMLATASADGIWTRGAIALQAQIPNVAVAFDPGFDESVGDLTAGNVTGLRVVADGDTLHAVWGSRNGLFYATGSLDPASTTRFSIERVTSTPPVGPSIAVVNGAPWVAYATSTSTSASIVAATPGGEGWSLETVSGAAGCKTCTTAVVPTADGPAVAFAAGETVVVATQGTSGWERVDVEAGGAQGISAASTADGIALSYYAGGEVHVATGPATGPFEVTSAAPVTEGSAAAAGTGTSIDVDDAGTLWLGWFDDAEGVGFASSGDGGFTPVDTGSDTANGEMPSVRVTPDGATAYLAWYDAVNEDLLLGAYGELEGLALAAPSPLPSGPPPTATGSTGGAECVEAVDGVVSIVALGIAFDAPCVNAPAGEPITIAFDNQDDGLLHNVQVYPSADEISADSAITQSEIITGPATAEYAVPALDAGTYYFQCDVHPQMNGAWNVVEGGGGATGATGITGATGATGSTGATGGEGVALTVTALGIAFDTSTIELPPDAQSTITFENQDAAIQHNIAIYADDTLAVELFNGQIITGPDTIDYSIPALPAGEYYFICVVHPTQMTGTVVVG
jgi:plastocyanin